MEKNIKLYSIQQVSELLGVHHMTVRSWLKSRKLVGVRVGRQWRVSHDTLESVADLGIKIKGAK